MFILCAEGLSSIISGGVRSGQIKGLNLAGGSSVISHLFTEGSNEAALAWKHILSLYERASAQVINFHKSSLCGSPNVSGDLVEIIKQVLGVGIVEEHLNYLGLLSSISHNKKDIFSPICEKISSVVAS